MAKEDDRELYITAVKSPSDIKISKLLISYDCIEKASVLLEIGDSVKFELNGKRVHVMLISNVENIERFLNGMDHLLIVPSDPLITDSIMMKLSKYATDKKILPIKWKLTEWASFASIGCAIDLAPMYYSTAFNLKTELKFTVTPFNCQLWLNIFSHNNDRCKSFVPAVPVIESRKKINIIYDCIKSHVLSYYPCEPSIDLALLQYDSGNNAHWNEVSRMALIQDLTDVVSGRNDEHVRTYYNKNKLEVVETCGELRVEDIKNNIMQRLGPELSAHRTIVRVTLFKVKKKGKPIMLLVANVHNHLHNRSFLMSILPSLNKIKAKLSGLILSSYPDCSIDIIVGGDWNISHTIATDTRKPEELNEFSLPPLFNQPQSSLIDYMFHTTSIINIFRQYEIAKTEANLGTADLNSKAINDHWPIFATCFIKADNEPIVNTMAAASKGSVSVRVTSQTMVPTAVEHKTLEMLKYYTLQLQQIKEEEGAKLPFVMVQQSSPARPLQIHYRDPVVGHYRDPVVGRTPRGYLLYKGPQGGIYHITKGGYKSYHSDLRGLF